MKFIAESLGQNKIATSISFFSVFAAWLDSAMVWIQGNMLTMTAAAGLIYTIFQIIKIHSETTRSNRQAQADLRNTELIIDNNRIEKEQKELENQKLRLEIELLKKHPEDSDGDNKQS